MSRDELIVALARRPFHPFRISVTDGGRYVIQRPELLMVTLSAAVIGIPEDHRARGRYPLLDRFVVIDLLHITKLEELGDPLSN